MYLSKLLTALLIVPAAVIASPTPVARSTDVNPFEGKNFYANSIYAKKLETTIKTFLKKGELLNAGRVRTIQKTGTFGWISSFSDVCIRVHMVKEFMLIYPSYRSRNCQPTLVRHIPFKS